MNYERRFRVQMTLRDRDLESVLALVHDLASDIKMIELSEATAKVNGQPGPTPFQQYKKETGSRWAMRLWPEIEAIFKHEKTKGDGLVRYDDQRLKDVLVKFGHNPHTITPLLSELRGLKLLTRPHRGWYSLP